MMEESKNVSSYCESCGVKLEGHSQFCQFCGTKVNADKYDEAKTEKKQKNRGKLWAIIGVGVVVIAIIIFTFIGKKIYENDVIEYVKQFKMSDTSITFGKLFDEIDKDAEWEYEKKQDTEYVSVSFNDSVSDIKIVFKIDESTDDYPVLHDVLVDGKRDEYYYDGFNERLFGIVNEDFNLIDEEVDINFVDNTVVDSKDAKTVQEIYVGTWNDTYSERAWMTITSKDGINFDIEIHWSSSAAESTGWYLNGMYDKDLEAIVYTGKRVLEVYEEDGSYREEVVNAKEKGCIHYNVDNEYLFWDDYSDHAGDFCIFEKEFVIPEDVDTEWYNDYTLFYSDQTELSLAVDVMDKLYVTFYYNTEQIEWLSFELLPEDITKDGGLCYYGDECTLIYHPIGENYNKPCIQIQSYGEMFDAIYWLQNE